ncbi:hypothetical protein GCM10010345_69730 [Streptomyces canarius]|uniref:Uncharacterized protein n=1 Tax=Streptomyces canarius TaxID=285453 RepID=A0ABQ3D2F9_9ACTN|nr:hypothetical protein GCM10010345_69730 [Streptomyces canarius]
MPTGTRPRYRPATACITVGTIPPWAAIRRDDREDIAGPQPTALGSEQGQLASPADDSGAALPE